jgi:hypothetical protein
VIEKINKKVDFLLNISWNNCINFANYCVDRDRDTALLCGRLNSKIDAHRSRPEQTIAYNNPIYRRYDNRWDRVESGVPGELLNSIVKRSRK